MVAVIAVYEAETDIPGRKVLKATVANWLQIAAIPNLGEPIARLIRETASGLDPEYVLRIAFMPEDARRIIAASNGQPIEAVVKEPTLEAFVQPNGIIGVRPSRQG